MTDYFHFNELDCRGSYILTPIHFAGFLLAFILFVGCSVQQKAAPDCNCSPPKALIEEVSIHTLQTARFSTAQMVKYMQGKCLEIDSSDPSGILKYFRCFPVIICGIPGTIEFGQLDSKIGLEPMTSYGFTTNLNFIDSAYKEVGITLPTSITTNEALRDTFGHRIHPFGGPDNDSVALYWHGILFDRPSENRGGGVDLLINDSTEWRYRISRRYDKQTGPQ